MNYIILFGLLMVFVMTIQAAGVPQVEIVIKNRGTIIVELRPDEAPLTTAHFLKLVNSGYYNGVGFNRVVAGFVIQGGDPRTKGMSEDPKLKLGTEYTKRTFARGTLSYARSFNSASQTYGATSPYQFFITTGNAKHLDADFCNFGYVVSGMEVADKVVQGDVIQSMKVITK